MSRRLERRAGYSYSFRRFRLFRLFRHAEWSELDCSLGLRAVAGRICPEPIPVEICDTLFGTIVGISENRTVGPLLLDCRTGRIWRFLGNLSRISTRQNA